MEDELDPLDAASGRGAFTATERDLRNFLSEYFLGEGDLDFEWDD